MKGFGSKMNISTVRTFNYVAGYDSSAFEDALVDAI
jgi:hypothetical protein